MQGYTIKLETKRKRIEIDAETYKLIQQLRKVSKLSTAEIVRIAIKNLINKEKIQLPKLRPKWVEALLEYVKFCYAQIPYQLSKSMFKYALHLKWNCYKAILKEIEDPKLSKYLIDFVDNLWYFVYEPGAWENPLSSFIESHFRLDLEEETKSMPHVIEFLSRIKSKRGARYGFLEFLTFYKDKVNELEAGLSDRAILINFKGFKIDKTDNLDLKSFVEFAILHTRDKIISDYIDNLNKKYELHCKTLLDCINETSKMLNGLNISSLHKRIKKELSKSEEKEMFLAATLALKEYLEETIKYLDNNSVPKTFPSSAIYEALKDKIEEFNNTVKKSISIVFDIINTPFSQTFWNSIETFIDSLIKNGKYEETSWEIELYPDCSDFERFIKEARLEGVIIEPCNRA